jgi:uncharacterized membrane protein
VGRDAFILGSGQFLLTSLVFITIATQIGFSANAAFVLGGGNPAPTPTPTPNRTLALALALALTLTLTLTLTL